MSAPDPGSTIPRPQVRSFVRRQGRITPAQRRAFAELWPDRGLELAPQPLDLCTEFPGCDSFVLEIGFGMGHALVELAGRSPRTGFIGIEVHRPGVGKLLAMAQERQLHNLRVYCDDAVDVLSRGFADASLDTVLLLFPDPGPRYAISSGAWCNRPLSSSCGASCAAAAAFTWRRIGRIMPTRCSKSWEARRGWRNQAGEGCFAQRPDWRPQTRFERRGLQLGHGVWDVLFATTVPG